MKTPQRGSPRCWTLRRSFRRPDQPSYLRAALRRHCTEEQTERAIAGTPASIAYETSKVTGVSALAGIPGGLAMVGTVPADLVQYLGHMLRISQKLAYIYSWPDLFADDRGEMDEATESVLILFVGAMLGVQIAQSGVTKVAGMIAANVAKKLPEKALTKGLIYPIVKKVSGYLGVRMTKKVFASGVSKAIPVEDDSPGSADQAYL